MEATTDETGNTILAILARHGLPGVDESWWISRATGGVNNRVYLAGPAENPAALTIRVAAGQNDPGLLREHRVLDSLERSAACIPEVLTEIPDGPAGLGTLLILRHAPGETRLLADVSLLQAQQLGCCLAGLHANRRDHYTIWPALAPQAGSYTDCWSDRLAAVGRYRALSLAGDLGDRLRAAHARLASLPMSGDWHRDTFCQLHGDLSAGNIIWGEDIVQLIDWEYSRAGDPAEDLAYLSAEQPVGPEQEAALFEGYLAAGGGPSAIERRRAYLPLITLDSALWWSDWALDQGQEPASLPEVLERLVRTERLLTTSGE